MVVMEAACAGVPSSAAAAAAVGVGGGDGGGGGVDHSAAAAASSSASHHRSSWYDHSAATAAASNAGASPDELADAYFKGQQTYFSQVQGAYQGEWRIITNNLFSSFKHKLSPPPF